MENDEFQELAERLRRGREKIEKALTETLTGRTEELVKKISDLRDRIEGHHSEKRRQNG